MPTLGRRAPVSGPPRGGLDVPARIDGAFPGRPEVEAAVHATVGQSYLGLGLFVESERHLRQSYAIFRRLAGDDDPRTIEAATELAKKAIPRVR